MLSNLSIRAKIIVLIVAVSAINAVILTIFNFYSEKKEFFKNTTQRLHMISNTIGEGCIGALVFKDKKEAKSVFLSFKVDENIDQAQLFLADSTLFAEYSKSPESIFKRENQELGKDSTLMTENKIVITHPVIFEKEIIGIIKVKYNLREYELKRRKLIFWGCLIVLFSIVAATFLAFFLHKFITKSIYQLEEVMQQISTDKDYTIRSNIRNKDEIGRLSDGFNSMIAQIEHQNNDLKAAKAQSDQALIAKERFLANITHELRTPLSSIIGLTTLLEETDLNNEQTEYFGNIKSSSNHLLSIINDLLEFSKIGSGKFQFEKKEFSVRNTISRIEGLLNIEIKKRNLDFISLIEPEVPSKVIGDEFRLNQILINLIGNAIKFTPKGKVEARVSKKSEDENTVVLEFRINDTGIGISKDKLEVIFESFTQESSSTNRKYGGTGLGLTITRQLIELQNGKIHVESEKGVGSKFIFYIPFDKKLTINQVIEKEIQLTHKSFKVMIVDDNVLNLNLTKLILDRNNFKVSTFQDGLSAVESLKSEEYDIILLDLHMPEIDGFEISKMMREVEKNKTRKTPIVALTAAATTLEIQKCFDAGMDHYIVKPFKKEELITKLLTLCEK